MKILHNLRFLIFLIACISVPSCKNDLAKVKSISNNANVPIQTGENVEIIFSENAIIKAKLNTPLVKHFEKEANKAYSEFPNSVQVLFYDSLKHVSSKLNAKYAINYETEKKMEARNDVVVVNEKGEILYTEHLIWDQKTEKIYSDVPVKVVKKDEVLFGKRFESDQYFKKWQIIEPTGNFPINN